jgi:heptosyltransferase-2
MSIDGSVKRVLVRAPNWIGDAVMTLPALSGLSRLLPSAEITVLAKPRAVPVYEGQPCVKEVMVYDDRGAHRGLSGRLRLASEVNSAGFGLAVLLQNAFDAAFLAFASRIPERAGYAADMRGALLTMPMRLTPEIRKRHQVHYYLNIIDELGSALGAHAPVEAAPRIHLKEAERDWAARFLRDEGLSERPLAGAAPGASYGPAKRWAPAGFAEVLRGLSDGHGLTPVVFGGHEDNDTCREVVERTGVGCLNLSGRLGLREFMAIAERTRVFVSNDSGPMHVASALGVPTVGIFGSTDPSLTGPSGAAAKVVRRVTDCSPCFERTCRFAHLRCLSSITAAEVLSAAGGLLAMGSRA